MDEVRIIKPYLLSPEYLDGIGFHYDVCFHGDDIIENADGENLYSPFKRLNKF